MATVVVTMGEEYRGRLDALARDAQKTRREMIETVIAFYEDEMAAAPPRDFPFGEKQVAHLTPRERDVLLLRVVGRASYEYIGKYYGVTRERIRQIEARALRRIRAQIASEHTKGGR